MQDILVIGSTDYSDLREIRKVLRRVEATYQGPFRLVVAEGSALASYAVGAARDAGWDTKLVSIAVACAKDCTPGHRRKGGASGTWCPTARRRTNVELMGGLSVVLVLAFTRPTAGLTNTRVGQTDAKANGLPLWQTEQTGQVK